MRALLNVEETLIALTYRLTKLPAISLSAPAVPAHSRGQRTLLVDAIV